jgi:hypothetical protein
MQVLQGKACIVSEAEHDDVGAVGASFCCSA